MAEAESQFHSKTDDSSKAMKFLCIVTLETEHWSGSFAKDGKC